jgi:tRNA G18 (ribose-2'-O)-methylase SpoU
MGENGNGIESLVIVHNVAKRHNVGTLARCATAIGAAEMVIAGHWGLNCFSNHGSASHLQYKHFPTLAQACTYPQGVEGC